MIEEIERGIRLGFLEGFDLDFVEKVELTAPERDRARRFEESLDRGEAACLAVAVERSLPVLTDDRVARRAARSSGLAVSGTLGCLVRLIDGGRLSLDEADRLLSTMRRVGYRSPVVSLRDLV